MSTHTAFWHETRRAVAQWVGVALASVLAGLLLGVLLHQGVSDKIALEIALPVGFLMALLFWIWTSRRFSTATIEYPVALSPTVAQFEGTLTTMTVYSFQFAPTSITLACQAPAA
jgi:hypothetical protein